MIATEQIYIPVNKRKLAGLLRLSISFTASGLFLALSIMLDHPIFIIISCLGIAYMLFFLPLTFSLFHKLKDRKAGITVDETGITDNTILVPAGSILWSDVQEIKTNGRYGKLLIIVVNNPTAYISRQTNFVKRKIMKWMFKTYGSPIIIASNELTYDFDKLQNLLQTELKENKS